MNSETFAVIRPGAVVRCAILALLGSSLATAGAAERVVKIEGGPAAVASSVRADAKVLDYGSFSWIVTDDKGIASLVAGGIEFEEIASPYTLTLGEITFDPMVDGAPSLPEWDAIRTDVPDMHLVQFYGPTRQAWLADLRAAGMEIIQYIHPFTYIVWGDDEARTQFQARSDVRWGGAFIPGFRVLPQWRSLTADPQDVRVLMYRGADPQSIIQQIAALGGKASDEKVLNDVFSIVRFRLPGDQVKAASRIPGVYSIKTVPTDGGLRTEMSSQVNVNNVDGSNLAFPGYQTWLNAVGYDGTGVIVANVDGGIQESHPDLVNQMIGCVGTTCGGAASSSHGTHTAGIMAGDGVSGTLDSFGFLRGMGVAPGASLVEQVYSPFFTQAGGMLLLMKDSYNNGDLLSGNSWGPAGTPQGYDDDTLQVDIGVRDTDSSVAGNQPLTYVLSFMNGNGGTSSQGSPDEAKNIFNIGSTKMQQSGSGAQILQIDDLSSNSAHGPALDGRTIPHMVAPGCYVDSTVTGSSYGLQCGTSMASPQVSGGVAMFIEYYRGLPGGPPDPSPALVKAAFLPVSRSLAGNLDADGGVLGEPFDSKQGWGRMDLEAVVDPQHPVRYFDNPLLLDNTSEEWSVTVSPLDMGQPIRIMLVWTDAPGHGLGGSTPAWNNDLDLVVEDGATTYRGNNIGAAGWSTAGGSADTMNNTEGVYLGPTSPGSVTIRVIASNINSDGVPAVGDATDQDFALVVYNAVEEPGYSIVATPTEQDVCAPANAEYNVQLTQVLGYSDPVTLSASGNPAGTSVVFGANPVVPPNITTMTIQNTGAAAPGTYTIDIDGTSTLNRNTSVNLTIASGSPGAFGQLLPANSSIDQALSPTLSWNASAGAATYEIDVATDPGFVSIVDSASGLASTTYSTGPLQTLTAYYWRVRAVNACGSTDSNQSFSFTTIDSPSVLLVDDDDNGPDVQSFYTTALNTLGIDYDIWNTNNSDNEPDAAALSPYSVVIWFTGDEFGGACGPGPGGAAALAGFLDNGNCLLISSQDYLYDRGQTSLMTNYLGLATGTSDVSQTTVTGSGSVFSGMGPYSLSYPFTNYSDTLSPDATAELAFTGNAGNAGINKDSGVYRTVFLGFPIEALPTANDRADILNQMLTFCTPVPQCASVLGDMTGDAQVRGDDIQEFVTCYLGGDPGAAGCGCADLDQSGSFENTDISMLVDCLVDNGCP